MRVPATPARPSVRPFVALALSVLLASAAAGCTDGTDATDPAASPPPESASEPGTEPTTDEPAAASVCDRIDLEELSRRTGVAFGDTGPAGEPGGAETCVFSSRDGGLVTYVEVSVGRTPLRDALVGAMGQGMPLSRVTVAGEDALAGEAPPGAGLVGGGIVSHVEDRTFTVIVGDVNATPRRRAIADMPLAVAEMIIAGG